MGFCVAKTRNGASSGKVSLPIVTCFTCIASSRALCTLAGARFTSSARMRLETTGPFWTLKSPVRGLYIRVPIRSAGSRSGVNWIGGRTRPESPGRWS